MSLELRLRVFVWPQQQSSFNMYLDALTERVPWFFALDHTNYVSWIPVHLRDLTELPTKLPDVAKEFNAGNFTIQKTNRVFSANPIDQAHEQNNTCSKRDGGTVGLTWIEPQTRRLWAFDTLTLQHRKGILVWLLAINTTICADNLYINEAHIR